MLLTGLVLLVLCSTFGCSYPRSEIGFWDQEVTFTAYGITWATAYGPFNLGYIQWQRNLDKNLTPDKPFATRP
jgi:hypothetical protein